MISKTKLIAVTVWGGVFFLCSLLPVRYGRAAGESAGKFTVVEGAVVVVKPGFDNRATVRTGDALLVGDILKTGENARAQVMLTDNSLVFLHPLSALRINQYAFDPTQNRRTARVQVLEGKTRFIVGRERLRNSLFSVETPHAVIGVGLADVVLTVATGETAVAVIDGNVNVKNSSKLVVGNANISTNQQVVIAKSKPPTPPEAITSGRRKEYRRF